MPGCSHTTLTLVGEQKTDDGVNAYYVCRECGDMLVVTPSRTVIGIKGVQESGRSSEARATQS